MTSVHALETTTLILADTTIAEPLLRLLYAFANAKGDPRAEAMTHDVMLYVWTKIEKCEEGMILFLQSGEASPTQLAA